MSVGDRNTRIGRCRDSCSDTRHNLNRDTVFDQVGSLLTTSTEQKGITPLETDDATVTSCQLHKHRIGARLRHGMVPTTLADKMTLTALRHEVKNLTGYQGVVNKRIASTQKAVSPHGE